MKKFRVSEIFSSIQGEGTFTGMPTIFFRFFGCNLKCDGFGQKDPKDPKTYILPYKDIDISSVTSMKDLPVFPYGCDSSYSWDSKFKSLAKNYSVEESVDEIIHIGKRDLGLVLDKDSPEKINWSNVLTGMNSQLCFTGGEPMLYQKEMADILILLADNNLMPYQVTIETNGTKVLKEYHLKSNTSHLHVSCSPKLYTVSGEKGGFNFNAIESYLQEADSGALKIVHNGTQEAWEELDTHLNNIKDIMLFNSRWKVYIMPVGSVIESQDTDFLSKITIESLKRGYGVSHRTHISIFGNKVGT